MGIILYKKTEPYHDISSLELISSFMKLTSPAFEHMRHIPSVYTCDGKDISPALEIAHVPSDAVELVLIVDDPDSSSDWLHWSVWGIDPQTIHIDENTIPEGAILGKTSFGRTQYGGPCPPSGTHRYVFTLYALNQKLSLPAGTSRDVLEQAMKDHIIAKTTLIGLYQRP